MLPYLFLWLLFETWHAQIFCWLFCPYIFSIMNHHVLAFVTCLKHVNIPVLVFFFLFWLSIHIVYFCCYNFSYVIQFMLEFFLRGEIKFVRNFSLSCLLVNEILLLTNLHVKSSFLFVPKVLSAISNFCDPSIILINSVSNAFHVLIYCLRLISLEFNASQHETTCKTQCREIQCMCLRNVSQEYAGMTPKSALAKESRWSSIA